MTEKPCDTCTKTKQASVSTGYISPGVMVLSHGDCAGVTVDLLNMFLALIECAIANEFYDRIRKSKDEVITARNLLNTWIGLKMEDPASCAHQEKLPIIQSIITEIVKLGIC